MGSSGINRVHGQSSPIIWVSQLMGHSSPIITDTNGLGGSMKSQHFGILGLFPIINALNIIPSLSLILQPFLPGSCVQIKSDLPYEHQIGLTIRPRPHTLVNYFSI